MLFRMLHVGPANFILWGGFTWEMSTLFTGVQSVIFRNGRNDNVL